MFTSIFSSWIALFFIILIVGFLFYRFGLTDNENKKVTAMPVIFILIGIGIFFSYKKYSSLFGWSNSLKVKFSLEEFSSYVEMSEKTLIQHFFELGINHHEYTKVYRGNSPDFLFLNHYDRGNEQQKVTAKEYNFSLGSNYNNLDVSYLSCFVVQSDVDRCYWQFSKKSLYEEALNSLKKYKVLSKNDESTDYQISDDLVVSDIGFDIVSKTYVLNIRNKGSKISIYNKLK